VAVTSAPVAPPSPSRPRPPAAASPPRSGVDAEARLLARAQSLLVADRAPEALALLARHEREHPDTALADVRDAIRVRALCAAGRDRQARAEAQLFSDRHPSSRLAAQVEGICSSDKGRAGRGSGR
jgi:hypothetical protein